MELFACTAGSNSDGGAKRKLEHSAAKMPTQRRRGSAAVVSGDPHAMRRSLSDGIICDAKAAACPKSPTVPPLNAQQQQQQPNVISPRVCVSPLLGGSNNTCFGTPHEDDDDECDEFAEVDEDGVIADPASSPRKLGQLSPLQIDCRQPDSPPRSPPTAAATSHCAGSPFVHGCCRAPELLAPLHSVAVSPSTSTSLLSSPRPTFLGGSHSAALQSPAPLVTMASNYVQGRADTPFPGSTTNKWQQHQQQHPPPKKTRNPGNLSLDLSQMEPPTFDPTSLGGGSGARHGDSGATCSRVTDFLFVGGAAAAKDRDALREAGVTHIINCAASVAPDFFPDDFLYYNIRLRDHSSQDIARHFYTVFDFIEKARRRGGRVFVHCVKGISRSPTMAIAYLMWYKRIGMYKALDFLRQARPVVDPNAGFIFQLTEWEHLHGGGSGSLRVLERAVAFRVELPRESSGNGNSARAAERPLLVGPLAALGEDFFHQPTKDAAKLSFVVAGADAMFVWCGAEASELQLEAAQHAAALLQAYEAFPEKYEIVFHGQESAGFWRLVDALTSDERAC